MKTKSKLWRYPEVIKTEDLNFLRETFTYKTYDKPKPDEYEYQFHCVNCHNYITIFIRKRTEIGVALRDEELICKRCLCRPDYTHDRAPSFGPE